MTGTAGEQPAPTVPGTAPDLVRHEQRLLVSTGWAATELVRVRKRIMTETRMVPVEVRVEVLDIEHLPLTSPVADEEAQPATQTPFDNVVIVLHEEVPVVTVEVRAVERATIGVRTITTQVAVSENLKSEQVDVATDPAPPAP